MIYTENPRMNGWRSEDGQISSMRRVEDAENNEL